jgi:transposase
MPPGGRRVAACTRSTAPIVPAAGGTRRTPPTRSGRSSTGCYQTRRGWPVREAAANATAGARIVDAIFYLVDNGIKWRALPADFPPCSTVYN